MAQFESSGENRARRERRRARLEEARRRVAKGETATPPPPSGGSSGGTASPGTGRARAGAAGRSKNVAHDPAGLAGERFALWRSSQHFCTPDSIPDAESRSVRALADWSPELVAFQLRRRIVGRQERDGTWTPVSYVKDGAVQPITNAQASKYRGIRLGHDSLNQESARELSDSDHPDSTDVV